MLASLLLAPLLAIAAPPERAALVVGADLAPPGRVPLRYAHDDAAQVAAALRDVGGFAPESITVLEDPEPDELLAALRTLAASELAVFYYSGHADAEALYPGGRAVRVADVKAALGELEAPFRLGVVDACRGGGWTGAKGLVAVEPFAVEAGLGSGTALIAASSGAEDAHEAEALGGSFFTRHWTAALRGPGDVDADGRVTLGESFAYARDRTVRDAVVYAGDAQHPSFHYDVRGRDELVLADLRGAGASVRLAWERGDVAVHALDTGAQLADLEQRPEGYRLVLAPGPYALRRHVAGAVEVARVEVPAGGEVVVGEGDFEVVAEAGLVARKGVVARGALQLSPFGGQWAGQYAIGSAVRPMGAELQRYVGQEVALAVGLTDRLALSILPIPGLSLRLGAGGGPEALVHVGGFEGGFGYSSVAGFLAFGDVGAGVDARVPVGASGAFQGSLSVTAPFAFGSGVDMTEGPSARGVVGAVVHLGRYATMYPALGLEQGLEGPPSVLLGSPLRAGARDLPLVQVHVTGGVSLDAHLDLGWTPAQGELVEEVLLGATFTSRDRRP